MVYSYNGIVLNKKNNIFMQHPDESQKLYRLKEVRHKRLYTVRPHLHDIPE